ncbi:MAG: sigma 54-interacting transcriptional regulator [Desulfobacterales bacterium]
MTRSEIKPDAELDKPLRFERLLAEISTFFINLPADRIDSEIGAAQRRVCEFLDLDRSSLFQVPEGEPETLLLTHVYQPAGSRIPPERMSLNEFWPWSLQKVLGGETLAISKMTDLPPEAGRDRESFGLYNTRSLVGVPLSVGRGKAFGVLTFAVMREERDWSETVVQQFKVVAQIFSNAVVRKQMEEQLKGRLREIENLKQQLEKENIYLHEEVRQLVEHSEIVGQSSIMKNVLALAEQVAQTDSTVLILGETGTGKELLARAIHGMSSRKDRSLVTVNCAALPPALIESELFGRERGAYTGALTRMVGRFELADGSTLFLDEIGELPHEVQSKLLRVLEQGRFERLGSTKPLQVNVRIIAATNRDLAQDVKKGNFRKDLYYRLNVFPILIPPLRERAEDIPLMVWAFVKEFQKKMGKEIQSIPRKTMEALQSYPWPGNVRELRNVIENAMILNRDKSLIVRLSGLASFESQPASRLDDVERRHIMSVLEGTGWRVAGKGGAAEALGLKRTTLYSKMKKLGIDHSPSK